MDAAPPRPVAIAVERPRPVRVVLASAIILLWALGTLGAEGVEQAGAACALLLTLLSLPRLRASKELRTFAILAVALGVWQALSPFVALATGTAAHLPRSGRWTQALDAVAPLNLAVVTTFGVPWIALAWILGVGWLAHTAMGVFQFVVPWPWERLGPLKFPMDRLLENVNHAGGPPQRPGLGLFFHRLKLAHVAVAATGPAVAFLLLEKPWRRRALALFATAALFACIVVTYARAALFAALLSALVGLVVFLEGRKKALAAGLLVACALAGIALSAGWQHRLADVTYNLQHGERAFAWKTGWELISRHPVLGVGFGNYEPATEPFRSPEWSFTLWQHSHNAFATTWAETGIVGLLLYLAVHLTLAQALWRRVRAGSIVAAGALLSQVGFHGLGLFHYPQFHSGVMLAFAFAWGLGLAPDAPGLPKKSDVAS